MKEIAIDGLTTETKKIKIGKTFIYIDHQDKPHRIKVKPLGNLNDEQACKKCCFNNDGCYLTCCTRLDRKSGDDVYYEELLFE